MNNIENICIRTKEASYELATYDTKTKNRILENFSLSLRENCETIVEENKKDIEKAKLNGISEVMVDRLILDKKRIYSMSSAIDEIIMDKDPIGEEIRGWKIETGLLIRQIRVPFGVIGVIYESRPNVTSDAIALSIKTSNAIVLKGGKEAVNSNRIIVKLFKQELEKLKLNEDIINLIETSNHQELELLLIQRDYVDLIIPRGGSNLINFVVLNSKIPIIETGVGNCHLYIDKESDLDMAKKNIIKR